VDRGSRAFAFGIAGIAPIAVAGLLVGVRGDIDSTNIALILVLVVVVVGALGGRGPAAVAAIAAAVSFDFFFTRPYLSLRIADPDDVETAAILLVIALLVGQVAVVGRARHAAATRGREELEVLRRFAERAAAGASVGQLTHLATGLLTDLLSLLGCRFSEDPGPARLPVLERSGRVQAHVRTLVDGEFALPAIGVRLPVMAAGRELGCFVMDPDPSVGVRLEARLVAVALADQLGAAIAAHPTAP